MAEWLLWMQGTKNKNIFYKLIILIQSGKRVKLACANWSGAQLRGYVVNGLDKQPLKSIAETISNLGFNCVRLVYSLDVIYKNPVIQPYF